MLQANREYASLLLLQQARALISDPAHWCTGTPATDRYGQLVPTGDPSAERFCLIGALRRVAGWDQWNSYIRAEHQAASSAYQAAKLRLMNATPHGSITGFNDYPYTTHTDVLRVLDQAIEAAEATQESVPK